MRGHATRTLLAAAAAGVTTLAFTAAGAAGAVNAAAVAWASHRIGRPSGGAPIDTTANCFGFGGPLLRETGDVPVTLPPCALSGYQASGRDFRFAQARITVPSRAADSTAAPMVYIALDASTPGRSDYARAGIEPDGGSRSGWDIFLEVQQPARAPVFITRTVPKPLGGHAIFFSMYLTAAGSSLHFVTILPKGTTFEHIVAVNGPVYTAAQALADWSDTDASPIPVTPVASTRLAQFRQGRFTTLTGAQGTFEGPWTLNPVEVTSDGSASPRQARISAPSYLWTGENTLDGLPGDAFGVWLYR
jgi:hypothetical protein